MSHCYLNPIEHWKLNFFLSNNICICTSCSNHPTKYIHLPKNWKGYSYYVQSHKRDTHNFSNFFFVLRQTSMGWFFSFKILWGVLFCVIYILIYIFECRCFMNNKLIIFMFGLLFFLKSILEKLRVYNGFSSDDINLNILGNFYFYK